MKIMRYLEQKGQGMVEYALILAFVVAVAVALTGDGRGSIRAAITETFTHVTETLNTANQQGNQGGTTQH